ncbi:hypothetical protein [Bacillus sp. Marseille-P3661]|uniref:hypothetical protein n=1 Tax=Bacillus sp. Marseille-P3661 TaxID=1936234 RepID=UPI0015E174E8|nr:hypothetical protein [Bacillus sp. Marseille-P3661]
MTLDDRKLSKVYRKIITADKIKAIWLYEKLDDKLKEDFRKRCIQNGSPGALKMLEQLK